MQQRMTVSLSDRRLELKYLAVGGLLSLLLMLCSTINAFAGFEREAFFVMHAAMRLGLVGLFLIAFVSNMAVIVNIPFMLVALPWVLLNHSPADVIAFSVVTGVGAGAGKLAAYALAARVASTVDSLGASPLHTWISAKTAQHPRFAPLLVFAAAGTVLPLDPALIPLLLTGYPVRKIATPLLAGKVVQSLSLALMMLVMSNQIGIGGGMNVDLTFGVVLATLLLVAYQIEKARHTASVPAVEPALIPARISS